MIEGHTTYTDKKTGKDIVEEFLFCPRCHQTIPITPELRKALDELKHGSDNKLPAGDIIGDTDDESVTYVKSDGSEYTPAT